MSTKLKAQLNKLQYKLLPLKILDSTILRDIRSLDTDQLQLTTTKKQ